MFNIDKQKFGAFVAALRKEKGLTQKELAERLFLSDKAVSKWETGVSVPGIDLLIPLSELLGVTVTELLMCRRMGQDGALSTTQVEQVVKTAISYSEEGPARTYRGSRRWGLLYLLSLILACLELVFIYGSGGVTDGLLVPVGLGAAFGLYFCFFAKEQLPAYYDENRISFYTDGFLKMNLPGLSLNNRNWGKVLTVVRIWTVTLLTAYPVIYHMAASAFPGAGQMTVDLILTLVLVLGGLVIPAYLVGKKYESKQPR